MLPAFATLVRANLRKVRGLEVPFYFATVPAAKRNVFFVGFRPGKASLFSSLSKISTHLQTRGRGELILPKTAKYCAGVVVRREGHLVFTVHLKKGISEAFLERVLPRMNRLDKLNLGTFVIQRLAEEKKRLRALKKSTVRLGTAKVDRSATNLRFMTRARPSGRERTPQETEVETEVEVGMETEVEVGMETEVETGT